MKLRLVATPVAFGPTDTSNYSGGAHRASFRIFRGDICLGGTDATVDIPLFNVAEIRELAACYGDDGDRRSVYLTISTEDESAAPPPLVNGRPSCCQWAAEEDFLFLANNMWFVGTVENGRRTLYCINCGTKLPEVK